MWSTDCNAGMSVTVLRWRHNGRDGVSNHQPHDCLLNHLFRRRSKKTLKLRVTGLCEGNSPGTGEFPAQMASNAENVTIWWRHHGIGGEFNIFAQILFYLFVRGTVGLLICCFCNVWKVLTNNRRHNIYSVLYNGLITFSWDLRRQKTRLNFHNKYRHFWLSERTPSSVIC